MPPMIRELTVSKVTPNKVRYTDPEDAQVNIYILKEDCGWPNHPQRVRLTVEGMT